MNTAPTTYVIRVHGHLDDHWSAWLGEPDMTRDDDGSTTITASIADQAQLHGVLAACATSVPSSPNSTLLPRPPQPCRPVLEEADGDHARDLPGRRRGVLECVDDAGVGRSQGFSEPPPHGCPARRSRSCAGTTDTRSQPPRP